MRLERLYLNSAALHLLRFGGLLDDRVSVHALPAAQQLPTAPGSPVNVNSHPTVDLRNTTNSTAPGHVELDDGNAVTFPLRFEVHYSDEMINIGGYDFQDETLRMMTENMDPSGMDFKNTAKTRSSGGCWSVGHRLNLVITVQGHGVFGAIDPLSANVVRDLLFHVYTTAIKQLAQFDRDYYEECDGTVWMETPNLKDPSYICGYPHSIDRQLPSCDCVQFQNVETTACRKKTTSHWMPEEVSVSIVDAANHTLTPTLQVTMVADQKKHNGCPRLISVGGLFMDAVSLWFPHIPVMIMSTIGMFCRHNGWDYNP